MTDPAVPAFEHRPVMLAEVLEIFEPVPAGPVVDATVGGGGHAEALLERVPQISLIGLDRDADAIAAAQDRLGAVRRAGRGSCTPASTISPRSPTGCEHRARSPVCCSTSASARTSSTGPSAASATAAPLPSTCAWTAARR